MFKKVVFILAVFISTNLIFGQTEISETSKLASYAKIWGFLKYYHPEVAKGKFDWDKEFITQLPLVLKATDKESLSKVYSDWIEGLGNVEICKKCDLNQNYFDKNFDLSWTQDSTIFTNDLSEKLKFIENNRNRGDNFYVSKGPLGNIMVKNEPDYEGFDCPEESYRLLGLFKYWNIIEYFFPYKYLMDQNWDNVLLEMIPKFQNASNKEEYQLVIKELIAKIDDSHAKISFDENIKKYLPVKISNIDNKPVVSGFFNDSLAKMNDLKLGDIIEEVNGLNIQEEANKNLKYISGSNQNIKMRDAFYSVIKGFDNTVELTIKRDDEFKEVEVKRYNYGDFHDSNVLKFKSINDNIGYVNMENISEDDIKVIFKSFENKKSIIIDLRNYPDMVFKSFSSYLNSENKDFAKKYSPDINYPGRYIYKQNLQTGKSKKPFKGKIIILVNDYSISLSEYTAMAFQTSNDAITIGSQTAGADGEVVMFQFLGGFQTTMTGNGVLYPDGTETQRKGVKIDVIVKPTISGLLQGKDEVLEKAIELASE